MGTSLNALVAREHLADLHRAANGRAGRRRRRSTAAVSTTRPAPAVRFARSEDAGALWRIAQLDDAHELAGEILVATIGADVVAAVSLEDGRVIANPFVLTSDAVELLRGSATALTGIRSGRRSRFALRLRLA
jgi:hypothetical protein